MSDFSHAIKTELLKLGADLVGFGNLDELPGKVRGGMPVGVSVAVIYPPEIIRGIAELPTQQYCDWYDSLNEKLDQIVTRGAEMLRAAGYKAIAQTRGQVGNGEEGNRTTLPHKTVARLAGIGWIGKNALLINETYGSAIRLSSILTDAPLTPDIPADFPRCGSCSACIDACPAGALSGKAWEPGIDRDKLVDPVRCRKVARARARRGFGGIDITICGKCIEICPYTRHYTMTDNPEID